MDNGSEKTNIENIDVQVARAFLSFFVKIAFDVAE